MNEYVINKKSAYMILRTKNGEEYKGLIDPEDIEKIKDYRWHLEYYKTAKCYYVRTTIHVGMENGKNKVKCILLHSMIMGVEKNTIIDHINRNPLDNRKENLRVVKAEENTKNRKGKNSNNTSGYRNVLRDKRRDLWLVRLQINKKGKTLGEFTDVHEAGKFAEEMRRKYYGEFAGAS